MFLRRLVLLLGLATATTAVEYTDTGIAIVGTTEPLNVVVAAGTSRQDLISHEVASYISVHFAGFNLPAGDSVVISSPDENVTVSHTYTGQGRDQRGTFIASFIPGNSVTVTYKSNGTATAGQGYRITGYSRGYPSMKQESICGDGDQSLPAKCYAPGANLSEGLPQAYEKSQAIARLLINGTYLCTGWLGGSEGHLFTNKHCFQQEDWALSTDIEFAAESSSCSEQCETQLGCPGTLVATTSTFITDSEDIDYSVVKLPDCVDLSSYGYLQFRESGPVLNESIYVPQHPVGHAKRIVSTVDNGDPTTIRSVGEDGDCGTDQVGHDADTQGGSSGSPLIAAEDNLVVAIHHCGGCTNTAIDVRTVLTDLASKNITIKNLVASEGAGQKTPPLYAQTPCTSQSHKKSAGQNHSRPCRHSNNSASTSAVATTVTPLPTTVSSTSSPVAASKSSSSAVTKTTSSSNTISTTSTTVKKTATSKAAALTAASLVTQRAAAPTSTPTTTAVTSSSSSSTTTSNSTLTTTSTSTSTTLKNSTSMKDCDSTPSPTSTSTSSTSEVDNDLLVGRLKAALTGSWYDDASPVSTPAAPAPAPTLKTTTHGPTPAPTWTWTHNPTTSSPTPAPTWTSTSPAATSRPTAAPTVASTPRPTPCSHTPGPTVKSTSKPTTSSPTPTRTVPSTPSSTTRGPTSAPIPARTVTSAPKPSTQTPTPKPTTVSSTPASTPNPTTLSPTPASTLTSTPKPTTSRPTWAPAATSTPKPSPMPASTLTPTSNPTPAPTVASSTPKPTPKATTPAPPPASTLLTSSSRGSEDVTQN